MSCKNRFLGPLEQDAGWNMINADRPMDDELEYHEAEWEKYKDVWIQPPDDGRASLGTKLLWFIPNKMTDVKYYHRRLTGNFGGRFTWMMVAVYFGIKGTLYNYLALAQLPYFMTALKVTSERYQAYRVVAKTPWSLKSLFGAISDLVPIYGYHKSSYIVLSAVFGTISFIILATTDINAVGNSTADTSTISSSSSSSNNGTGGSGVDDDADAPLTVGDLHTSLGGPGATAAILMMFGHLQVAVVDLLTEGKYAEMMIRRPKTGGDLVSWVWALYFTAQLIASVIVGPMADRNLVQEIFWIAVPFSAQVAIPIFCGFFPEKQLPRAKRGVQWQVLKQNKPFFIIALLMGIGSMGLSLVTLYTTGWRAKLAYSIVCSVVLCSATYFALPTQLAKCNLYMFLASAMYLQLPGALEYWYTGSFACTRSSTWNITHPGITPSPNFDMTYFITYSSIVGSIFGALGIMLFQSTMSKWRFRPLFWVTTCLRCMAAMVDIIMIKRWNISAGIPDKAMYMLGNNIVATVIEMLDWMPGIVLTSKLCPKHMESTVYAMLAGFQNFGQSISISLGLALSSALDVEADIETNVCNFEKLPELVVISHIILPLCVVPLTFILIPDLRMTDNIQIEHDAHGDNGDDDGEGDGGGGEGGDRGGAGAAAKKKKKKKKKKGRARSGSDDSQVGLMDGMSESGSDDDSESSDDLGGTLGSAGGGGGKTDIQLMPVT